MKKLLLLSSFLWLTNLFSQNFQISMVPKIKADTLYIAYVLSFRTFPVPAPTIGEISIYVDLDESYLDLDKGRIVKTSRYDVSNPASGNHFQATQLSHVSNNNSLYRVTRNPSTTLQPYNLVDINNDTLGIVAYPIIKCYDGFAVRIRFGGQSTILNWGLSQKFTNDHSFINYNNQSIPKQKQPTTLSLSEVCTGKTLTVETAPSGSAFVLNTIRNGSIITRSSPSNSSVFGGLIAGTNFINNDRFSIAYKNAIGCDDTSEVKAVSVISGCCDSLFNDVEGTYCISGFSKKLVPNTPGGVFSGDGVAYNALLNTWTFTPALAGGGNHDIVYKTPTSGSCKGQTSTQKVVVTPAPCASTVVNSLSNISIPNPAGVFTNCSGEVYVTSSQRFSIFKVDTFGVRSVFAGDTIPGLPRDGNMNDANPLNRPKFCSPLGIIGDSKGNIYIADIGTHSIIRINASGNVETIGGWARTGVNPCFSSAYAAVSFYGNRSVSKFNNPYGVALNQTEDTLYVSESRGNRISAIDLKDPNYKSFIVAGDGLPGFINGNSATARFLNPQHISVSGKYLYVADAGNNMIRRIDLKARKVITLAGQLKKSGDPRSRINVDTSQAFLDKPSSAIADCEGNVYFVEPTNNWILRANQLPNTMTVTRFAGDPSGNSGTTDETFDSPQAISFYSKGYIDVADQGNGRIMRLSIADWAPKAFNGLDTAYCQSLTRDTITPLRCSGTLSCVENPSLVNSIPGNAYTFTPSIPGIYTIAYRYTVNNCLQTIYTKVRVVGMPKGILGSDLNFCGDAVVLSPKVGAYASHEWTRDGQVQSLPVFQNTFAISQLSGNSTTVHLKVVDVYGCMNRDTILVSKKVLPAATILATSDTLCFGQTIRLAAQFQNPADSLKYFKSWNTYNIADTTTRIVANGSYKYEFKIIEKNAPSCSLSVYKNIVQKNKPQSCMRLYTKDNAGNISKEYDLNSYKVSTVPIGNTDLSKPSDVLYHQGSLYIADRDHHKIKRYNLTTKVLSDFIGSGSQGFSDSSAALTADLNGPTSIAVDKKGNFYICNKSGNHISKYDIVKNKVYLIAGNPLGSGMADGEGKMVLFNEPVELDVDAHGNVYVTERLNNVIRKLSPVKNSPYYRSAIYTGDKAGNRAYADGKPSVAKFDYPWGVAIGHQGEVFVSEDDNHVIRKINLDTLTSTISGIGKAIGDVPTSATPGVAGNTARYNRPWGIDVDESGIIYVCDAKNNSIKKIDKYGKVTKIAGLGEANLGLVDGSNLTAKFNAPTGISIANDNKTLYIADRENNAIRKVKKMDTVTICQSEFNAIDLTSDCTIGNNIYSRWIFKNKLGQDSVISGSTIRVKTPGLYISEIKDSTNTLCTTVLRDSIWVLPWITPVLTVTPSFTVQSRYCLDQTLNVKILANPMITGTNTYTFTSVQLYTTPIVNSLGEFEVKLDRNKLTSTSAILNVPFRIDILDSRGCKYESQGNIVVDNTVGVREIKDTSVCLGDTISISTSQRKTLSASLANFLSYTWKPSSAIVSSEDALVGSSKTTRAKIFVDQNQLITVVQQSSLTLCKDSTSFNVILKAAPKIEATPDTGLCGGGASSIVLNASVLPPASDTPYRFTWYNLSLASDSTVANSKTVAPTTTTKYRVKVVGNNGCKATDSTIVGVGLPPTASILTPSADTTVCPLDSIRFSATASGGKPYLSGAAYRYEWRNMDDNSILSAQNPFDLSAVKTMNIRLQVKDSIGCSSIDQVKVNVNTFNISGGQKDTTICYGTTLQAAATVASGSNTYTYFWNRTAPLLSDPNINNPILSPVDTLVPTQYVLTVTDNYNCELTDTVRVSVGTLPKVQIAAQNDFCEAQNYLIGSLATGGALPYRFAWSEPSGQALGFAASDTSKVAFFPNAAGYSYVVSLKVIDANSCESPTANHIFNVFRSPYLDLGSDTVLCNGETVLKSVAYSQNSGLNIDFVWFKDGVPNANTNDNQLMDAAGTYKVVLTTDVGCAKSDSMNVSLKDSIRSLSLETSGPVCKGGEVKLLLNIDQGTPDYTIKWSSSGAGTLELPLERTTSFVNDSTIYKSVLTDLGALDFTVEVSNACNVLTRTITQTLNESPTAVISSYTPNNVYINQIVNFTQSSVFDKELIWNFGDNSPALSSNDITVGHTYVDGNTFTVTLLAVNNNGCTAQDQVVVNVINNQNIYVPNVFSPSSSNAENSHVKVYGSNISNSGFNFVVFNRWGHMVYQTSDFSEANKTGWNGRLENVGDEMTLGSYTYLLKGKFGDGKEFEKVGTITLVK